MAPIQTIKLPDTLPVIPLTERVLLPGLLLRVTLESESMLALLQHLRGSRSTTPTKRGTEEPQRLVLCVPVVETSLAPSTESSSRTKQQEHQSRDRKLIPGKLATPDQQVTPHQTFAPFDDDIQWHRTGCAARVVRIQRVLAPTTTFTVILQGKWSSQEKAAIILLITDD